MQEVPPDFIDMDLKEACEEPDPDTTKSQKEQDEKLVTFFTPFFFLLLTISHQLTNPLVECLLFPSDNLISVMASWWQLFHTFNGQPG